MYLLLYNLFLTSREKMMMKLWCLLICMTFSALAVADQPATIPEEPTGPVTVTFPKDFKLPSSPGFFRISASVSIGEKQFPMVFGVFLPAAYFSSNERMPLVVALHNRGLEGATGQALDCEGLAMLWANGAWDHRAPGINPTPESIDLRKPGLYVGLAPQSPKNREMHIAPMPQVLAAVIDVVTSRYRIDSDRVYLTGFSYGGTQVWPIAAAMPGRFAAIAPFSGRAPADPARTAATLANIPAYVCTGEIDHGFRRFSEQMHAALIAAGHTDLMYKAVPGGNHHSYCAIYTDQKFWDWLLSKRISHRPTTRPATRPATTAQAAQ